MFLKYRAFKRPENIHWDNGTVLKYETFPYNTERLATLCIYNI